MSALRTALAAGAMSQSASPAATATGIARQRSSRSTNPANHATNHPSTARLNPEIARMCASPAARKLPSVGRYPGSTSPSTSATSIGRTPCESGTPASSASRTCPRSDSRARASASANGAVDLQSTTGVASRAESSDSEPTRPSRAAAPRTSNVVGIVGAETGRKRPTHRSRSPIDHAGRPSPTNTVIVHSTGSAQRAAEPSPHVSTNTISRTSQRSRGGLLKCRARRSGPKSTAVNPDATVTSTTTSTPSGAPSGAPSPPPVDPALTSGVARASSFAPSTHTPPRHPAPISTSTSTGHTSTMATSASGSRARMRTAPSTTTARPASRAPATSAVRSSSACGTATCTAPAAAPVHPHPIHNPAAIAHVAHGTSGPGLHARARSRRRRRPLAASRSSEPARVETPGSAPPPMSFFSPRCVCTLHAPASPHHAKCLPTYAQKRACAEACHSPAHFPKPISPRFPVRLRAASPSCVALPLQHASSGVLGPIHRTHLSPRSTS